MRMRGVGLMRLRVAPKAAGAMETGFGDGNGGVDEPYQHDAGRIGPRNRPSDRA